MRQIFIRAYPGCHHMKRPRLPMVLHLALGGRGGVPINFKGSPPREGGLFKRGSLEGGLTIRSWELRGYNLLMAKMWLVNFLYLQNTTDNVNFSSWKSKTFWIGGLLGEAGLREFSFKFNRLANFCFLTKCLFCRKTF